MSDGYNGSSVCEPFGVCVQPELCWDASFPGAISQLTCRCWILAFSMIGSGFFLILLCELSSPIAWLRRKMRCSREGVLEGDDEKIIIPDSSPFTSTRRSVENFVLDHDDPLLILPSKYSAEYTPSEFFHKPLPLRGFFNKADLMTSPTFITVTVGSFGIAMICSGVSTIFWQHIHYDRICHPDDEEEKWFDEVSAALDDLITNYKFYPIFLLVTYIGYTAAKWRDWMVNCHTIQARLHDIGLICGSSFTSPPTTEQRKLLYDIYRLLNAAHALCYQNVSPTLCTLSLKDFCDRLNLLTSDEVDSVSKYEKKFRDAVIAIVSNRICLLTQADNIDLSQGIMVRYTTGLRGVMARHHDLFVRENPNMYISLMFAVVDILLFFTIVAYPFILLVKKPANTGHKAPCFQLSVLLGTFLVVFSYRSAYSIIIKLRNPFIWTNDHIKVDELMASTEMTLFTQLRSSFTKNGSYTFTSDPNHTKRKEKTKPEDGAPDDWD